MAPEAIASYRETLMLNHWRTPAASCTRLLCAVALAVLCADLAQAQVLAEWPLETLKRADGKIFSGLMLTRSEEEMEFVEVVRPPGKPMYLVVHYYPPAAVKDWSTISDADRVTLKKRIGPLLLAKHRSRIERGRMDDVQLHTHGGWQVYRGKWFTLRSNAGDEAARRAVVRMEQIFRAYSLLLPPAVKPRSELVIKLYGTQDGYQSEIQRRGLRIENPAFYSQRSNLIVAGSDIASYSQLLGRTRAQNAAAIGETDARISEFSRRLTKLRADLKKAGFTASEIRLEAATRRTLWEKQQASIALRVAQADRRNDASFEKVSDAMFRRLYHEAFHAYLENYVFPQQQYQVPRWLNEGLAQIFESGQLEAGVLRIDAPHASSLRELKTIIASPSAHKLRSLIEETSNTFIATHDKQHAATNQYLLSWGLTYYLVFERNLLQAGRLKQYADSTSGKRPQLQRFEQLTGEPFPSFYKKWREAMLKLR